MNNSVKKISAFLVTTALAFSQSVTIIFAANEDSPPANSGIAPIQNYAIEGRLRSYTGAVDGSTFTFYLIFIWRALIFVAGMAVLIALVTGAIEWINAGGDKSKIEKAREKMTQAVVGFVVLVGLIAIAQFLQAIFGINILSPNIPTVADPQFN